VIKILDTTTYVSTCCDGRDYLFWCLRQDICIVN